MNIWETMNKMRIICEEENLVIDIAHVDDEWLMTSTLIKEPEILSVTKPEDAAATAVWSNIYEMRRLRNTGGV